MHRLTGLTVLLLLVLVVAINFVPMIQNANAAPQRASSREDDREDPCQQPSDFRGRDLVAKANEICQGLGAENRDDPCSHLPDHPGKANEIDKNCPAFGSSSGIVKGDFNNDGFTDLAIGEPGATIHGLAGAGDVIILYGSANGLGAVKKELWYEGPDRNLLLNTLASGNAFGSALASGDFNGDGFTDLAIGAPNEGVFDRVNFGSPHAGAGAVTVIYGSANGLTTTDPHTHPPQFLTLSNTDPTCLTDPAHFCEILQDNAHFGQSLAWGNFNGDQLNGNVLGDLAIAAPTAQDRDKSPRQGGVIIVFGRSSGLPANNTGSILLFDTCCVDTAGSDGPSDAWGSALSAGDFDGDGNSDLAIGVPGWSVNGAPGAGAVFIFTKIVSDITVHAVTASSIFGTGSQANAGFGGVLASGDFNGDLKSDLAIGQPNFNSGSQLLIGAVDVLYGSSSGITDSSTHQGFVAANFHGINEAGAHFGAALVGGDFDGDGRSDLVIGVPFKEIVVTRNGQSVTLTNAGEINVIYGSLTGLSFQHSQIWNQETLLGPSQAQAGNRFGAPLTAWNFGNNEVSVSVFNGTVLQIPHPTPDLAVGVPFQTVNGVSGAGAVNVIFGSFFHGGLGTTFAPKIFTADSVGFGGLAGAHFGAGLY